MTRQERYLPPDHADERSLLESWLEHSCAGLNDEQLRNAAVPPSGISLPGLVRH